MWRRRRRVCVSREVWKEWSRRRESREKTISNSPWNLEEQTPLWEFKLLFSSFPTTIAQHDRFGEIEIRNRPRSRPSAQNAANRPPITHSLQFHTLDKIIFQANFHSQVVLTLPKIIVKSVDFPEGVKIQNSSSTVPLADAHNARISPSANCTVRLFGCPLTLNNRSMIESTSSVFAWAIWNFRGPLESGKFSKIPRSATQPQFTRRVLDPYSHVYSSTLYLFTR